MQQSRRIFALGFGLVASLGFTVGALAQGTPARELTVASSATYAPFAFENKDKQIVGFDIDIINAIAKQQGLKIKVINTPWSGIFAALNNGDVDLVISGVTINDKRRQPAGYDVTWRLGDQSGTVRTSFKPGATLPVKDGQVDTTPPADAKS